MKGSTFLCHCSPDCDTPTTFQKLEGLLSAIQIQREALHFREKNILHNNSHKLENISCDVSVTSGKDEKAKGNNEGDCNERYYENLGYICDKHVPYDKVLLKSISNHSTLEDMNEAELICSMNQCVQLLSKSLNHPKACIEMLGDKKAQKYYREASYLYGPTYSSTALSSSSTPSSMTKQSVDFVYKVVILGFQGCGKSTILNSLQTGEFVTTLAPTIGVDFYIHDVDVDNVPVKLKVWDTAGQEKFRSISISLIRGSSAALFVFDVSNPDQSHEFKQLTFWYKYYCQHASPSSVTSPVIIAVGNKVDNIAQSIEEVHYELISPEIRSFLEENKIDWILVSAKWNYNILECFEKVAKELYARHSSQEFISSIHIRNTEEEEGDSQNRKSNKSKKKCGCS